MHRAGINHFSLAQRCVVSKIQRMAKYSKILLSVLMALACTVSFAAGKPNCKKTGKNCPMNDKKECNCGKDCDCGKSGD